MCQFKHMVVWPVRILHARKPGRIQINHHIVTTISTATTSTLTAKMVLLTMMMMMIVKTRRAFSKKKWKKERPKSPTDVIVKIGCTIHMHTHIHMQHTTQVWICGSVWVCLHIVSHVDDDCTCIRRHRYSLALALTHTLRRKGSDFIWPYGYSLLGFSLPLSLCSLALFNRNVTAQIHSHYGIKSSKKIVAIPPNSDFVFSSVALFIFGAIFSFYLFFFSVQFSMFSFGFISFQWLAH